MKCELACRKHPKFKTFGRHFVEFWHDYFLSTGISVRDLPIKSFLSAVDLVKLCDLSACSCKNLVKNLFPDPSFACKYCQNSFSTMTELNMHIAEMNKIHMEMKEKKKKQTQQQQQKQFQCIFCTKCLLTKVSLIRHMELHTKEFECKICGKAFNFSDIDRHKISRLHLERVKNQLKRSSSNRSKKNSKKEKLNK